MSCISYCTRTVIVVDQVNAGGTVLTLTSAIVEVLSARRSTPALLAATGKRTGRILATIRVDAWSERWGSVRFTLVQIGLTYVTRPFRWTLATKPSDKVDAGAAVFAWTTSTFIDVCKKTRAEYKVTYSQDLINVYTCANNNWSHSAKHNLSRTFV